MTGNCLVVESPTGNQYSRNTTHVNQYIRDGDPTPQQGSDSVSTPPTPQQEKDPVPSPYQPTIQESTAGLLDRGELPCSAGESWSGTRSIKEFATSEDKERLRDYG